MIKVFPFIVPQMSESLLLGMAKEFGQKLSCSIDPEGKKVALLSKFFSEEKLNDKEAILEAGPLLRCFTYSFVVVSNDLLLFGGLPYEVRHGKPNVYIVSGTLAQWREAIVFDLTKTVSDNRKIVMSRVLELFDQMGLSLIFQQYRRRKIRNHLFLEDKNANSVS